MATGTLVPTYPNPLITRNATMIFGIESSLLSSEPWLNGDTICKDLHTLSPCSLITRIWHTLENHNDSTNSRLEGAYCLLNMTWNSYMYLEQGWSNLTHSHNDWISALRITRITLTKPSHWMVSLWVSSHWMRKNRLTTLTEPYYQTTYLWTLSIWVFRLRLFPAQTGTM